MSRFVREARQGENHWAYYALTIVLILLAFVIGQIPIGQIINYKISHGLLTPSMHEEFKSTLDFTILGLPTYLGLILMLLGHILAAIVLCISIVFVHKRPLKTVITSRKSVDFRRVFFAFELWMVLSLSAEIVMYMLYPQDYSINRDLHNWLPLLIVTLLLLPIQTSFEEVFIRGYLLQGIALLTRSKWVIIAVTSVIFAAMHLGNPEVREFGLGLMGFYYISVALFLVIITFLDEGLELALGIHAATNVYGSAIVSFEGSVLQTDALVKVQQLNPEWMIALFFVMMLLFIIIAGRKYKFQRVSSLFQRIELTDTDELNIDL
jgi:CAAX protease family protein